MSYTGIESIPLTKRREIIKDLTESQLWPLIARILEKIGFNWVDITHGIDEHGRDLVGSASTITGGSEYVGFVVKAEPISGGVSGKTTLITVMDQVKLALSTKYIGPNLRNPEKINRIVVVTNQLISNTAKQEISSLDLPYGSIEFWQLQDLEKKVTEFYRSFYLNINPELYEYLIALRSKCEHVQDIQRRVHYSDDKKLTDIYVTLPIIEVQRGKPLPMSGKKETKIDKSKVFGELAKPTMIEDSDLLIPKKDYILVGGPGSGKSCVLRRTCINLVENRLSGNDTLSIPLFINARDLVSESDEITLSTVLDKIFCSSEFNISFNNLLPEDHTYTLFVDGLDEVPPDKTRSEIYDSLLSLASEHKVLHLIISSRPLHMWREGPTGNIQEGSILPIQRSAMADLLQKLISKPQKSAAVLREITKSEVFQKLPRTPLVVTLIALLHEEEELPELPANLSDLYELFCMVYLERWTKGGQKKFDIKIAILELFALHMHKHRITEVQVSELLSITKEYLSKKGSTDVPELFMTELIKENLLLFCKASNNGIMETGCPLTGVDEICSSDCTIGFIHLSFQEFFVARNLKRRPSRGEIFLADNFDDPWWGSIGMFFSGFVKDIPNLIEKVTSKETPGGPLSISRMVNLGQLTQAATQTDLEVRIISCLHGSALLEDGYKYGIELNKKYDTKMSRFQLVGALCWLYEQSFSSYHLSTSLKSTFEKLFNTLNNTEKFTEEREIYGLQILGVAWALADTGDIDSLLELSKLIDQSDGVFTALMTIILESIEDQLKEKKVLPKSTVERREEWLKSIKVVKKRAKRYKNLLIEDMNKEVTNLNNEVE